MQSLKLVGIESYLETLTTLNSTEETLTILVQYGSAVFSFKHPGVSATQFFHKLILQYL